MKKKTLAAILLLTTTTNSHAGFYAFTMHSRANCGGFNESVSWHWQHLYNLITYSNHTSTNPKFWWICNINTLLMKTSRSAAYHWAEGYAGGGWTVRGAHYIQNNNQNITLLKKTEATDCAIYDGWWDK